MDAKTTRTLGREWLNARKIEGKDPLSVETIVLERDTWSAYARACREINECLNPKCHRKVESERDGYCPVHREAWRRHHAEMKMKRNAVK
jgi:hypothetical protein